MTKINAIACLSKVCYDDYLISQTQRSFISLNMKAIIRAYLKKALKMTCSDTPELLCDPIPVEYSRNPVHGDFSSSIALLLAKPLNTLPYPLAERIAKNFQHTLKEKNNPFQKIEVVQPGFINFFIQPSHWLTTLSDILHSGSEYGRSNLGQNQRILVEFVSSNPTGPLHIGHGRAAAQGNMLVQLLKAIGYQVHAEYYVNDAGRQVDILACSIWLR